MLFPLPILHYTTNISIKSPLTLDHQMTLDEEVDGRCQQDHWTDGTEDLAAGGSSVQRIFLGKL